MTSTVQVFAIPLAAVLSYVFGAIWYMSLSRPWLAALGKTPQELQAPSPWGPKWTPFVISIVAQLVMAAVFASLLAHFPAASVTWGTGLASGFLVWLGFVATTLVTNHGFQASSPRLTVIDGAHWLGVLLIQGAVLGQWGVR